MKFKGEFPSTFILRRAQDRQEFILSLSKGFTLIELLIVIGILAALAGAVVLVLNPAELLRRTRDATRMEDLATLNRALGLFQADRIGAFTGTSSVVYISIPDTTSTCANLSLPSPPQGWSYACASPATYRNVDGTGWVPVAFTQFSSGSPLSKLPVDPINTTSTGEYYTYVTGGSWHLTAFLASDKYRMGGSTDRASQDSGSYPELYELGSNLTLLPVSRDPSLVGYWKFDEGNGTSAYDASGKGNNGFLGNSPTWQSGSNCKVGSCLNFNGSNQYIEMGNNLEWPGALTVSSWHKRTTKDTVNADGIFGNWYWDADANLRRGWVQRYYINQDVVFFTIELTNGSSVEEHQRYFSTTVGEWYHVVGTFNPSDRSVKLYVNGELRSSSIGSSGFDQIAYDSSYPMRAGYNPINGGYFPGFIDDIRIYNRALSAAEILAIYDATQ